MKTRVTVIVGMKINRLTALEYTHTDTRYRRYFKWLCECGQKVIIQVSAVTSGNTKSCGCLISEAGGKQKIKQTTHQKKKKKK